MNNAEFFLNYLQKSELLQNFLINVSKRNRNAHLRYMKMFSGFGLGGLERLSESALHPPSWRREFFKLNELYSHDLVLKRAAGVSSSEPLRLLIEHGLFLNKHVIENSNDYRLAAKNVVMSSPRSSYLKSQGVMATEIGPYIHYATPIVDVNELVKLKEKLGRVLLFFPGHSTKEVSTESLYKDVFGVIRELELAHDFDTVLVCGHYLDIEQGLFLNAPKSKNYLYVSAGFNRCPVFLDLLRTFIELSDVVASNAVGTQTGYAMYLGKPFWVARNHMVHEHYSGSLRNIAIQDEVIRTPLIGEYKFSFEEFERLFENHNFGVESDLYDVVSDLWGFSHIKQPSELREIILCENTQV